jgi:hypothetical protein
MQQYVKEKKEKRRRKRQETKLRNASKEDKVIGTDFLLSYAPMDYD